MAVYTDGIHLIGDTVNELHEFAVGIGLNRKWFNDHRHKYYDVIGNTVEKAITAGAIVKETRALVRLSLPNKLFISYSRIGI
jgi:hypothetical protein